MIAAELAEPWAVLIAALGASVLTIAGTMAIEWQRSRHASAAATSEAQLEAYSEVLARSGLVAMTADTLRLTMHVRSGLTEGLNVALGYRKLIDPIDIDEQLRRDLGPFWSAMARISVIGTPQAVVAAQNVAIAVADVMAAATTRGDLGSAATRALRGERWTTTQLEELESLRRRLGSARQALADVARSDLGSERFALTDLEHLPS